MLPPSTADPSSKGTVISIGFQHRQPGLLQDAGNSDVARPSRCGRRDGNTKTAVAILDKAAASKLWPNQEAVGKHIRMILNEGAKTADAEIVGVAGSMYKTTSLEANPRPHLYVPFGQEYQADMQIHLKVAVQGDDAEARMLDTIRREIRSGGQPVARSGA